MGVGSPLHSHLSYLYPRPAAWQPLSTHLGSTVSVNSTFKWWDAELQKRADRADQLVLFFLAGANFWEKHAKNCAIMSMAHITYAIAH